MNKYIVIYTKVHRRTLEVDALDIVQAQEMAFDRIGREPIDWDDEVEEYWHCERIDGTGMIGA